MFFVNISIFGGLKKKECLAFENEKDVIQKRKTDYYPRLQNKIKSIIFAEKKTAV